MVLMHTIAYNRGSDESTEVYLHQISPNVGIAKGITSKRTVPQPLNMVPPSKYKTTKEKPVQFNKNFLQKISG